jgi:hypothetical protein
MLANIVPPTNDFHALARYLVHGKPGTKASPDRVAWIRTHNLHPELAATLMMATAQLSKRCKNAAYHAMIAWHPDEKPTPEQMQLIAKRTLELAGLGEHQTLIMGHGDTPHQHLHMLINRVHPTTGKAWDTKHDYRRFDTIMRQLAEEHGFRYEPAHRFNPDETDDRPTKPKKRPTYAAKRGAKTKRPQWSKQTSREYGQQISERLDQAASWDDVEMAFAEDGLTLEAKGTGMVVGTSQSYTKLSALGLTTSAHDLEKRFGSPYKNQRRHPARFVFAVDAVDIVKALSSWGLTDQDDINQAIDEASRARSAKLTNAPLPKRVNRELRETLRGTTSLRSPSTKKSRVQNQKHPPKRSKTTDLQLNVEK